MNSSYTQIHKWTMQQPDYFLFCFYFFIHFFQPQLVYAHENQQQGQIKKNEETAWFWLSQSASLECYIIAVYFDLYCHSIAVYWRPSMALAVLYFYSKTGFFCPRSAKSQPIWIKFCKHLLLYGIHLWADLDHDQRVGGSRPNQNDCFYTAR